MADRIHTVSEITRDIRLALEGRFRRLWVEGEVSNLRVPGSGHHYFTLKDAGSQLSCVMFRLAVQQNAIRLVDGQKIQVFGDVSVYEARGQIQLVVQVAQMTGDGELQARFEALKRKLQAEGLFAPERKKAIPVFPRHVAVVTSPTGAAIQDILKVMSRRAPWLRLSVVPVRVQGDGAAREIAGAIDWLSSMPRGLAPIDTIIVGRGGGSIEDLWAFNEEVVARAIHACSVPVVSGIGHEIDFTIADFVADRREPTPSAAAEATVPDGVALRHRLGVLCERLGGGVENGLRRRRREIESIRRELSAREPARQIRNWAQSMDYLEERLRAAVDRRLDGARFALSRFEAVLAGWDPTRDVLRAREDLERQRRSLTEATGRGIESRRERLRHLRHLLEALGPDRILDRGFSLTMTEDGSPVHDAGELEPGQILRTRFARGEAVSRVEKVAFPHDASD